MFKNRENSGFHLICDIYRIQKDYTFHDLYDMMEWIICLLDVKMLDVVSHRFDMDKSFTILMLLAESHLSIHTYPEMDYIALDLYTCRNYTDDEEYKKVINFIIEYLDCFVSYDILVRGIKYENTI